MDNSKSSADGLTGKGKFPVSGQPGLSTEPVDLSAHWITGQVEIEGVRVPVVATSRSGADILGAIRVRCAIGRNRYRIAPGLYAVGSPSKESPVFVSANYKLSFDHLRVALHEIDGWILVLDTKGINVWCAAGKGTFGTKEIISRVLVTRLAQIVSHRRLIVPQLGAPGVAAHEVRKSCGFSVSYGPIRANDIRAYMRSGEKATPEMRRVRFNLADRAILIPTEIKILAKYFLPAALVLGLLAGFGSDGYSIPRLIEAGSVVAGLLVAAYLMAATLVPILLPYLPGRAFALKGAALGAVVSAVLVISGRAGFGPEIGEWHLIAWPMIIISLTSAVAMNFTGSSTYTSLSGVRAEMRRAVPLQIVGGLIGLTLFVFGLFISNGWKG